MLSKQGVPVSRRHGPEVPPGHFLLYVGLEKRVPKAFEMDFEKPEAVCRFCCQARFPTPGKYEKVKKDEATLRSFSDMARTAR